MFLNVFKTGQALLLPGGRILRPRGGRNIGAKESRNEVHYWPQTRSVPGFGQAKSSVLNRTVHDLVQSATASNLSPQAQHRTGCDQKVASAQARFGQGNLTERLHPQAVRKVGPSRVTTLSSTEIVPKPGQGECRQSHRIGLSAFKFTEFPVQVRIVPIYGNI